MFLLILSLFLDFILGSDSGYPIKIIIFILFISAMLLYYDTSDEIESKSFNLIKEHSLCLCIVDDKGNKHCGRLEGITYNVLIRDMDGILVGIPYDYVYKVEECKAKD